MAQLELALDGIVSIQTVSRSLSSSLGGNSCSIKLERPYDQPLTRKCQLASVLLSESSSSPVKFFTGWMTGFSVQPDGKIDQYSITLKDLLLFEDNQLISDYHRIADVETIASDLLQLSGASGGEGTTRKYFDLTVIRTGQTADPDNIPIDPEVESVEFIIEKAEPLSSALQRLCDENGYDISVRERGWTSIAALRLGNGAIADLILRKRGVKAIPAPRSEMVVDPNNTCSAWWEGEVSYQGEWPQYSGVLFVGANGDEVTPETATSINESEKFAVVAPQVRYQITSTATRVVSAILTANPAPVSPDPGGDLVTVTGCDVPLGIGLTDSTGGDASQDADVYFTIDLTNPGLSGYNVTYDLQWSMSGNTAVDDSESTSGHIDHYLEGSLVDSASFSITATNTGSGQSGSANGAFGELNGPGGDISSYIGGTVTIGCHLHIERTNTSVPFAAIIAGLTCPRVSAVPGGGGGGA